MPEMNAVVKLTLMFFVLALVGMIVVYHTLLDGLRERGGRAAPPAARPEPEASPTQPAKPAVASASRTR